MVSKERGQRHKKSAMNCIAIWCTGSPHEHHNPQIKELECHYNLWMLNNINPRQHGKLDCFLDIGVMLSHAEELSHVNIFIPDQLDRSNIQDLGLVFKNKTELVSAVFNEDYGVLVRAKEKTIEVLRTDGSISFHIYVLDLYNDVSLKSQFGGSIISIQIPEHLKNKRHYYRIRLKCSFVDHTGYIYTPPASSILEGAFFQTELVDLRFNEKRNLPSSLLEIMRQNCNVLFTKTHFFLMREASDDYIFSHKPPGGRQLEKEIWKAYVGENYSFEQITAYHWKEATPHDSFNVFVKFRSFHSSLRTIFIAIGVIIGLGIISSFLGDFLYWLINR
ncbi:MAG: hypothetical protein A2158_04865 [Chloroflexi bacterium RBG_13_46_14]|nr:MAG: hypothetical protein A2158_04865 [Chloroflexi bacterium RBG_13_46_14]